MSARRDLAAGTAGSALLAVGALGVGALPRRHGSQQAWAGSDLLRATPAGRTVATVLAAAGLLLLIAAWWRLRAAPLRSQLLAAGLWALPLLLAPPLASRDVYAYAAQGALVHAHLDPYTVGPQALPGPLADSVATQYAAAPSPYGPVFLGLAGRVVALTGQHVVPAVLLLRLLAVAGLALLAWALPRLAPGRAGRAVWLGVANPLVLLHAVGGAHNDALMAGLLAAGLAVARCGRGGRLAVGAVLVTLGGLVKLPALAALAVLSPRRPRPLLVVGGAAAATALACSGLGWRWLRTATAGVHGPDLLSPVYGAGRALQAAGVPHGLGAARAAGSLAGAGLAAVLLIASRRPGAPGALPALGWALVALAALAPSTQPWYLLWGLPALACAAGDRAVRGLAAACSVLCLAVLPNGRPLLQGPVWGLPVLVAAAAGLLAARSARVSV